MNAEIVNVGYAGVGKHAEWSHIEPQLNDPHASIQALYDIDNVRSAAIRDRLIPGVRLAADWDSFVGSTEVEAIYAITPDRFHTPQLLDILAAEKHAFIEKPLADTWEDFEKLRTALLSTPEDRIISTCHPRRFDPPFVNTKRLLDDRALLASVFGLAWDTDFGPVQSFELSLNYSRPSKSNLHTSFASDHLPHEIDTASHFFGLQGLTHAVSRINEELAFDIEAVRDDGIKLHFQGNRLQDGKQYREDWKVGFGEGVALLVDAHTGEIALTERDRVVGRVWQPQTSEGRYMYKTDYDHRFEELNKHFVASVRAKESPYLSRNDMLMNTVVALALQEVGRPAAIAVDGSVTWL